MRYASLWDRLVANIRIEGDCWTWTGPVRRHGGGHRPAITVRAAPRPAHPKRLNAARVMCELVHGPAPGPEYDASHLCLDNWLCICPDHVLWETKAENRARLTARRRSEMLEIDYDERGEIAVECPF